MPTPSIGENGGYAYAEELVEAYFDGLHTGDIDVLARVFDADAALQSDGLRLARDEWLEVVASRSSPSDLGHPRRCEILNLDLDARQGVAKVRVALLGKTYVDYLSLLKEGGRWRIVNKLYAQV